MGAILATLIALLLSTHPEQSAALRASLHVLMLSCMALMSGPAD